MLQEEHLQMQSASVRLIFALQFFVRATLATTQRTLRENLRAYPWSFLAHRLLLALFTIWVTSLIYNVLFDGETLLSFQAYIGSEDYLTFIVIGISIQAYASSSLLSLGRSLITERRMRTIDSLFLTPAAQSTYLLGTMLQQVFLASVDFLIILAIGLFFGADFSQTNWIGLIIVLISGLFGFMGMGILLSAVMLYLRDTYLTQNTVLTVLLLICGVLFPIQYLPEWVQQIAQFIPYTHTLRLARESTLLGYTIQQQGIDILYLLLLSVIYYGIGLFLVYKVRYIALEKNLS